MKVLKFGGSSVRNAERIRAVKKIIELEQLPLVVVVSAFQGVTDSLKKISELAASHNSGYRKMLKEITALHGKISNELLSGRALEKVRAETDKIFSELGETLNGLYLLRELSKYSQDKVLGAGERLSSSIISAFLGNCTLLDSRELIRTDDNYGNANVDFQSTNSLIRRKIRKTRKLVLVPGFIASTQKNEITTLGRGGSDYTAAIIAAALNADMLEIWTDTDGFMTADPKKVEKAYSIESLTFSEAIELSHFGAKVIYTPTLRPVYKKRIPVTIRNSFNPGATGTLISDEIRPNGKGPIKGISSIDHIDLVTLQGPSMVGVTGTSMRLFGSLARRNINIILITQASSEYSITFAINPSETKKAVESITQEFEKEIIFRKELRILVEKDLSVIAIVGEKMKNTPGVSATLFRSLGRNGINVVATAQGSSELNISVVIKTENLKKALNVIHDGFFLSRYKELHLFIAGTGFVGSSLLGQLLKQNDLLLKEHNLKINLLGVANSRRMIVGDQPLPLESWREKLEKEGEQSNIESFIKNMTILNLRNSVFVDCTANAKVAGTYAEALKNYVSVVTASKIACSSEYAYYHQLKSLAAEKGIRFMYETTVGAGLPVIKTINDLVVSGDRIIRIEAVLSGTLNFIFNTLGPDMPLSKTIRLAKEKGISEPDPRIDLCGTDVVRKILILAREAGYSIDQEDVKVEKVLPDECFEGSLESFYERVSRFDSEFEEKRKSLVRQNRKWRFFASLDQGRARVELITVDSSHPTFDLEGSNNIILLTTERYRELPMVIKGYGAGADVTAAGIFADIMRVVNV